MREAPLDSVRPEASPCFPAEPIGNLDKHGEKYRAKLHARHVHNDFDLVGTTLLRKREFDLIQAKQEQWMRIAKAPGINPRNARSKRKKTKKSNGDDQDDDNNDDDDDEDEDNNDDAATVEEKISKAHQRRNLKRGDKAGAASTSTTTAILPSRVAQIFNADTHNLKLACHDARLPHLRKPPAMQTTRKRRREFEERTQSSINTSHVLGSSTHLHVLERRESTKRRLSKAHSENQRKELDVAWQSERANNYEILKHMSDRAEFEQLCHCNVRCKRGTPAVIKCFSCIKFDPLLQGHFCQSCFLHSHPPHRLQHNFIRINDIDSAPLKQEWRIHMQRLEIERRVLQYKDVLEIISAKSNDRNTPSKEPETEVDEVVSRIEQAAFRADISAGTLRALRKRLPKSYSAQEAAVKIQSAWRTRQAQNKLYRLFRSHISAHVDPNTGKTFYYNSTTKRSSFTKPAVRKPRMNKNQAASRVQALFRQRRARAGIRELVQLSLEQHLDPATNKVYYYSHGTGVTYWEESAPAFVRQITILTPRTRARRKHVYEKRQRGIFKSVDKLSPDAAASMIQSRFRARKCRQMIQTILLQRLRRIVDAESGKTYYFDTTSGQTSWEKPALLEAIGDDQIKTFVTPRQARDLTPDQAARMLQRLWKCKLARDRIRELVLCSYEKIYDPQSKEFFVHNPRTGQRFWMSQRPAHLNGAQIFSPRTRASRERAYRKREAGNFRSARSLDENTAARMIQASFRARKDRKRVEQIFRMHIRKLRDPETNQVYFYNKLTNETTWVKPKLLQDLSVKSFASTDESSRTPRQFESKDEAAIALQGMYRRKKARDRIRALLQVRFEKHVDPDSGEVYFYNTVTNETSWQAPALLDEVLTPRARANKAAIEAKKASLEAKKASGQFRSAKDMTEQEAASMVQLVFRANRARQRVRQLLLSMIARASDDDGNVYWVNMQTMEASYVKPTLLRKLTDSKISSYRTLAVQAKKRTPRKFQSENEAAVALQGMYRRKKARDHIRALLQVRFEKHVDPDSGEAYFLNTVTNETSWQAPALLDEVLTPRARARKAALEAKKASLEAKKASGQFRSAKDMTEQEAASMVQRIFRANRARERVRQLLQGIIVRARDPEGYMYYVNTQTMEASYVKPTLLRKLTDSKLGSYRTLFAESEEKRTPRKYQSEGEAASVLQAMYRRKRARDRVRAMLLLVIEKPIDGDGNEYYFNTLTNTSSWTKPSVLANVNPMTPRRRKQRALAQKCRDAGLYKSASMLAPAEAATMIQSWYRGRRAILRLRDVLTGYIAKAHDAEGNLYYINLDTNEATWEKPTLLRDISDSHLASFKDNMW